MTTQRVELGPLMTIASNFGSKKEIFERRYLSGGEILDINDQSVIDYASDVVAGRIPIRGNGHRYPAKTIAICGAGPYALAATIESLDDLAEVKGGRTFRESGQTPLACLPWEVISQYIDFSSLSVDGISQQQIQEFSQELFDIIPATLVWPIKHELTDQMVHELGLFGNIFWPRKITEDRTVPTIAVPTLAYRGLRNFVETIWNKYQRTTFVTSANLPKQPVCTTAECTHRTFPHLAVLQDLEVDSLSNLPGLRGWGSYSIGDMTGLPRGFIYGLRQSQLDLNVIAQWWGQKLERPITFSAIENDPFRDSESKPMKVEQQNPVFSSLADLQATGVFGF